MKKRLLTFISALFILFLTSNCAGIKPFFQVENVPGIVSPCSKIVPPVKRHIDNCSYVPTSADKSEMRNLNRKQYKFSVSFPASVRLEF